MLLDRVQGLAHGLEQRAIANLCAGVAQEVREPPSRGPRGCSAAHPAELLLDPPSLGGQEVSGFQLGQGDGLLVGQLAAVMRFQDRLAGGGGHLHLLAFRLAHVVRRSGE